MELETPETVLAKLLGVHRVDIWMIQASVGNITISNAVPSLLHR